MARNYTRNRGFTLIEIMVVVVIIGIALALALPRLFPSDEELTREESEQVLALLQVARDEAAFGGRAIAARVVAGRLEFFERDTGNPEQWNPIGSPDLKPRTFAAAVTAQLSIAGSSSKDLQIIFLPAGVGLPFELALQSPTTAATIVGDAIGNVRLMAR